jgi:hypothetical protein
VTRNATWSRPWPREGTSRWSLPHRVPAHPRIEAHRTSRIARSHSLPRPDAFQRRPPRPPYCARKVVRRPRGFTPAESRTGVFHPQVSTYQLAAHCGARGRSARARTTRVPAPGEPEHTPSAPRHS